jgi:DNA-binding beta-propeller fold protein YncE
LPAGAWVDVIAAADAAREAEEALAVDDLGQAKSLATRAVSLAQPPFLAGEEGDWVAGKRRELVEVLGRGLACLSDASLRSGETGEAAKWAEELIVLERYRETGYRLLMEAHAAAGNRAEALRVYERCRRLLADELGAFPSPETELIYRALLQAPSAGSETAHESLVAIPKHEHGITGGQWRTARSLQVLAAAAAALLVGAGGVAVAVLHGSGRDEASSQLTTLAGDSVAVVDPTSNTLVDAVKVGGRPAGIAVGRGAIWVGNSQHQTLVRIDPATRRVTRTIGLPVDPWRIAIGADAIWVISRESKALVRVDSTFDRVASRIDLSDLPPPEDLAAGANALWIAHGRDLVSRVSPKANAVVGRIRAGSASGIAFGEGAAWSLSGAPHGYLGQGFERIGVGALSRIDPATNSATVVLRLPEVGPVGLGPVGIAFGERAIWMHKPDGTMFKVDAVTGRLESVFGLGESASTAPSARKFRALDAAVGEGAVWTANNGGTVSRIDPETAHVMRTIPLGREPRTAYPVEIAAGEGAVWVTMH